MTNLTIVRGDITKEHVDAIVNAANTSLLGGGGIDGAIHRAAGPKLLEECSLLGGCRTGEAKITKGHNLPAKYVIHAVGPVWQAGKSNEAALLADCYRSCLGLAKKHEIKTIAFPAISTGAYGFPKQEAAEIAVQTVNAFVAQNDCFDEIRFIVFSEESERIYHSVLKD